MADATLTSAHDHRLSTVAGPVLLIGAGGMLARAWQDLLVRHGVAVQTPSLEELDITRPATIEAAIGEQYRWVVNCAAWTNVDGAETAEDQAMAVNAQGVANLAAHCRRIGAVLVHYSTDYVFDGQATQPYRRDQRRQPLNAYGRTKARGEELLEQSGCEFVLARTSWLYAPWGNNFVRTIARLAREKSTLRVVDDQRGRPTSAEHLAATTLGLLEKKARGIWHVTDGGECTWCDFARQIVHRTGAACRVEPCTTAEFPRPAKRPAYSVLDIEPTEKLLGPMPQWKENLGDVVRRLEW